MTPLLAGAPQAIVREFSQQRARRGRYFSSAAANYIEDVFQTYLYTGNSSTQTIPNGIDLAGEGGLTWIKGRSGATAHQLFDTARGATKELISNSTAAEATDADTLTAFNADGFSLGADANTNTNAATYTSWTFRKAAKFFDVVTWTGDGSTRQIPHALGSIPGCIIVKRTDASFYNWLVYHRSTGASAYLILEGTQAQNTNTAFWNATTPDSSTFTVGNTTSTNASGGTYVAYLFAHDAGGFGDSGNDSVISCGSYTGSSGTVTVDLGWEPQWVLIKKTNSSSDWQLEDNMRGMAMNTTEIIAPNLASAAEPKTYSDVQPRPTGFTVPMLNSYTNGAGSTFIYIAIRRGPMRTPTDATKVYATDVGSSSAVIPNWDSNFPIDFALARQVNAIANWWTITRLTGTGLLQTHSTAAEVDGGINWVADSNAGWGKAYNSTHRSWMFRRAPGFFDVVAYTGTDANRTVSHNLGVAPELMIVKRRSDTEDWAVYTAATGNQNRLLLNLTTESSGSSSTWNNTSPTSSVFSLGVSQIVNGSGSTYIAYLFASCPGVSKVGSYTGTGTTLSIDCGFTAGARFVLIKRTDSTGDWYVWDTARGIVSGNDPYLLLNSTAAEVTNTDFIDPLNSGFQISSTAPAAINANGGTFIFLAIA